MDHEQMKSLREKINAGYIKNYNKLLENLDRVYSHGESGHSELRGLFSKHKLQKTEEDEQKSIQALYNQLYEKIQLEPNFEKDYEKWVEDEVLMFVSY